MSNKADRFIFTHDWEILKGERIRRWPSKTGGLRGLSVEISTWRGICIGAKHFEVRVTEEDNQWWCEDENAWVTLTCDAERSGYNLSASVLSEAEAIKVALFFVRIVAGPRRLSHRVSWSGHGKPVWAA